MKPFYKQKTFWAGIAIIITAIVPAFTELRPQQITAITTALGGLGLIFLREAVNNE